MSTSEFTTPTGQFIVASHGNGWAYEVTCQTTGESIWLQDDDAQRLRTDTDNFNNEAAINTYFECLLG